MIEKPNAITRWSSVNQLLDPDERFEISLRNHSFYNLVPKHSTRLIALVYTLNSEKIPFKIMYEWDCGFECIESMTPVFISIRYFNSCAIDDDGILEVGSGCSLFEISSLLFTNRKEIALEGLISQRVEMNLFEAIFNQKVFYTHLKQNSLVQSILGIEGVTYEGVCLKWGNNLLGSTPGFHLHQLLLGIGEISFIPIKFFLRTYPIPEQRIYLLWTFKEKQALLEVLKALKSFSNSWERLDVITSRKQNENAFLFAQISGLSNEMKSFFKLCPYIQTAKEQNHYQLKRFFQKKNLIMIPEMHADDSLNDEHYFWYQDLDQMFWMVTSNAKTLNIDPPIWKKRFETCLRDD